MGISSSTREAHGQPAAGRPAMVREGTASGYLVRGATAATSPPPRIPVRVFKPGHFQLPEDSATPIVMFAGGTGGDRSAAADQLFRRLVARGRLMLDVFTTFAPSGARTAERFGRFDASEVIEHNNAERGYWIIIRGNVYDMTEFMYLHPGGERLLVSTAGMDGTASYEKAEHHLDSGVHALLDLYKIGSIRRLDFRDVWNIAVEPKGTRRSCAWTSTNSTGAGSACCTAWWSCCATLGDAA